MSNRGDYTYEIEFNILKDLKHPFIIKPQELIKNKAYLKKSGQILYKSGLVFDLDYHGNLFDYISDSGPFSEKLSRTCFHQMIDVMEYLEMKGIAHCDIKTEILFFDQDFNIIFTTFLLAQKCVGKLLGLRGTAKFLL